MNQIKKIKHQRTVFTLFVVWCWLVIWIWPHAVQAGTLSADLKVYDWISLGWSSALGLLGGVLALIVALATDDRVLHQVFIEGARNALVSPIAGAAAYLLLEALAGMGWLSLPPVGRFLVIVGVGWAGIAFFIWAKSMAGKASVEFGNWLVKRGGN